MVDLYPEVSISHLFLQNFHLSVLSHLPNLTDFEFPHSLLSCHCQNSQGSIRADQPWFKGTGASHRDCRSSTYHEDGPVFTCCSFLPAAPEAVCRSFFFLQLGKHSKSSILLMQYKTYKLMLNILSIRKCGAYSIKYTKHLDL